MLEINHIRKTAVRADTCSTGIACLLSIIRFHDGDIAPWLLSHWASTKNGLTTLGGLRKAAEHAGFKAHPVQMTIEELKKITSPVILFYESDDEKQIPDFVVCYGFDGERFIIADASWGLVSHFPEEVELLWIKKIALTLFRSEIFITKKRRNIIIFNHIKKYIHSDLSYFKLLFPFSLLATTCFLFTLIQFEWLTLSVSFFVLLLEYYIVSIINIKWTESTNHRIDRISVIAISNSVKINHKVSKIISRYYTNISIRISILSISIPVLFVYLLVTNMFCAILFSIILISTILFVMLKIKNNHNYSKIESDNYFRFLTIDTEEGMKNIKISTMSALLAGIIGIACLDIKIGIAMSFIIFYTLRCIYNLHFLEKYIYLLFDIITEYRHQYK